MIHQKVAYSIHEALKATGLGRTRLYQEIRSGRIQIVKVGRRTLIPSRSLEQWLTTLSAGKDFSKTT
jgi:excisionase family DNA binding protein